MIDTFGIPFAFVIISILVLWFVIGSKGWWWIKALVVAGSVLFSISLWHSLDALQGWPTNESLPDKFEIKWLVIKEPNKKTGDEGGIYVWAKDLQPKKTKSGKFILHNKGTSDEPRLHTIPYSRKMHEQAEGIKKQIAAGKPFYGEVKKGGGVGEAGKGKGKGKGEGKGRGRGKGGKGRGKGSGRGGDLSNEQDPIFHELPPPVLPEKITDS